MFEEPAPTWKRQIQNDYISSERSFRVIEKSNQAVKMADFLVETQTAELWGLKNRAIQPCGQVHGYSDI